MKVAAIIPARGGSTGIPGKNIKRLGGLPLVARSINAALASRFVTSVHVSTDNEEIASVSRNWGADVIQRPTGIATAISSSEEAILHAIDVLSDRGEDPDVVVFIQCTSPFTTGQDIDAIVEVIAGGQVDSSFTASANHAFLWELDDRGLGKGINHRHELPRERRQDMSPQFMENGAAYAFKTVSFKEARHRFCGRTRPVLIDAPAIELDEPRDWIMAESWLAANPPQAPGLNRVKAVVMDFDGVLTDDLVIVAQDGTESVSCSRSDGFGVEMLREEGFDLFILSREVNPVVRARAAKLKIDVLHGIRNKLEILDEWRASKGYDWEEILYVGNDVNDLECMEAVGISMAPVDAHKRARMQADHVLSAPGGQGAVRAMADMLMFARHGQSS